MKILICTTTTRVILVIFIIYTVSCEYSVSGNPSIPESSCRNLCRLSPETMEGPYHVANQSIRSNISEDLEGVPLVIMLIVKNYNTCTPMENITVDIWHSNVEGDYSGFGHDRNKTYCRGLQITDVNGSVTFQTIYPGWYEGRAIHIHIETFDEKGLRHVGQLYLPQALTLSITRMKPYSKRWTRPIPHQLDWLYRNQGGAETVMDVEGSVDTVIYATKEVAIDPSREVLADNRQYPKITTPLIS